MLNRLKHLSPQDLGFFACLVIMGSLTPSKALLSIGTGILAFAAVWQVIRSKRIGNWKEHRVALVVSLLFLLPLLSVFYTTHVDDWAKDIRVKLTLVAIPLAFSLLPRFCRKHIYLLLLVFIAAQSLMALGSVIQYFLDFEHLTETVKKNSSLNIIGKVNHIYFGLALACANVVGIHLFREKSYAFFPWSKYVLLFLVITGITCIHILTSRTGLVAFYGGVIAYVFWYVIRKKAYLQGLAFLAVFALIPVASYFLFPSFKYRFDVTVWDAKESQKEGQDLSFHSVGLRFVAWQTAWEIFQDNPILGVGIADLEHELIHRYEVAKLNAKRKLWLSSTHNQYLEHLAGLGLLGLGTLLGVLCYMIWFRGKQSTELLIAFMGIMAAGMLSESFLERQMGIALFTTLLMLIIDYEN